MRSKAPLQAKALDNQLQMLQSFVLDAVAPLTSIVEASARGITDRLLMLPQQL